MSSIVISPASTPRLHHFSSSSNNTISSLTTTTTTTPTTSSPCSLHVHSDPASVCNSYSPCLTPAAASRNLALDREADQVIHQLLHTNFGDPTGHSRNGSSNNNNNNNNNDSSLSHRINEQEEGRESSISQLNSPEAFNRLAAVAANDSNNTTRIDPLDIEVSEYSNEINLFRSLLFSSSLLIDHPPSTSLLFREALTSNRVCYRFLKARSFSVTKAVAMFTEAVIYRADHELDTILDRPFLLAIELRRLSQHTFHKWDKQGRPILIECIGSLDVAAIEKTATLEQRIYYHHYQWEYLMRRILPAASKRVGHTIDKLTSIFDMRGLHKKLITTYQYHFVKSIIRINSLLYPELLSTQFVVNAPTVFTIAWGMVKGFLDKRTRQKIFIYNKPPKELYECIGGEELPKRFGGKCDCESSEGGTGKEGASIDSESKSCLDGDEAKEFDKWVMDHAGASVTATSPK